MPNDPLTNPVLSYLRELADDFRKQNAPIHVFEESEWVRESNGNIHKTRVERPFLGFFLDKHKKTSSLYMDATDAIRRDSILGGAVDALVGDEGGQTRFDCESVISHALAGVVKQDGTFLVTKKAVSGRLGELRRYLAEPMTKSTLLIPLPGIKSYQIPFVIERGIEIDRLSAKEVGWCVESGALRLANNDFPSVWVDDCVGLRIRIESNLKITKQEELEATSDERLKRLNEVTNKPHEFGSISRWKIAECVEDLLFVLRLARPEFIGTAGAVLVTERPTGRSSTWITRSTRSFMSTTYQIDPSTGRMIRSFWREMKARSGKTHGLPSICERRFNAAMDRVSFDDAIVDHLVAAEALFLRDSGSPGDRSELSYRLSLRTATLLATQAEERLELFKFMKAAYMARSHIAHGGPSQVKVKVPGRVGGIPVNEFVDELGSVMRRALQKAISMYPKDSAFGTSEYWDSLILRK